MKKNERLHRFFSAIVQPPYQFAMVVITSAIVLFLVWLALLQYRPLEKPTLILPVTPQKIKSWGGDPTVVETGLFITNWHEFDVRNNTFGFDGIVWFQFDPALVSLDTIGKFSFEKGELLSKSKPDTKLIDDKLFAEYEVRIRFTSSLNYQLFPFDDHEIYIGIVNSSVTPKEIIFKVHKYSLAISENIFIPNWKLIDYDSMSGYEAQRIDRKDDQKTIRLPKVVYMLDFRRSGLNLIMIILIPLFLIFFIGLFSFSFDPALAQMPIVLIATTALTSLITYRFVIQRISPNTGYLMFSDLIFMLFLSCAFVIFIIGMMVVKSGKLVHGLVIARGISFVLFHFLVICAWVYLLFFWI